MRSAVLISGVMASVVIAFILGVFVGVQTAPGPGMSPRVVAGMPPEPESRGGTAPSASEPGTSEPSATPQPDPGGGLDVAATAEPPTGTGSAAASSPPAPETPSSQSDEPNWIDHAVARLRAAPQDIRAVLDLVDGGNEAASGATPASAEAPPPAAPVYAIQTSHSLPAGRAHALAERFGGGDYTAQVVPLAQPRPDHAPEAGPAFVRVGPFPDREAARRTAREIQQEVRLVLDILRISAPQTAASAGTAAPRDG